MASSYQSVDSSIRGCGKCTIYGDGVQLVFWPEPTTVSRDMCASEPTASVTHYGPGAVITAYAGKSAGNGSGNAASASTYATAGGSLEGYNTVDGKETIVADGHIFTSGTAYISISKVSAVDRCSKTYGSVITDAILAMPSQSVLSLRYSQDHFQRLMETDKITGYPVNYADFHTPIPWSAWNGQNICLNAQDNYACTVINENFFRPQLAIPPQITELSPDFEDCQMWYNGLWDPPLALTEYGEVAKPTLPAGFSTSSEPASPSSSIEASTATATATSAPTALPNELPSSAVSQSSEPSVPKPTLPPAKAPVPSNEPWTTTFELGGETYTATGKNKEAIFGTVTCSSDGPAQTLEPGVVVSYGANGCVFDHETVVSFESAQSTNGPTTEGADTVVVTVHGTKKVTMVQSSNGGVIVAGTHTLTPGADAVTLGNGKILSAATGGLVVHSQSTLGVSKTHSAKKSGSSQHSGSTGSENSGSTGSEKSDSTGSSSTSTGGYGSSTSTNGGTSGTTSANGGVSGTTSPTMDAAQSSSTVSSGSSLFSTPVLTSFLMVLFVAGVVAV